METLTKKHFNHTANEMSEESHFATGPWHEVWDVRGEHFCEIPYDLVLLRRGDEDDMAVLEKAEEYRELKRNHS